MLIFIKSILIFINLYLHFLIEFENDPHNS